MIMENKAINELLDQSSGVLEKAYDDLAHPSAKSIGNTVSLIPRTIGVWLGKWEKWVINGEESIKLTSQAVEAKASQIPEEKLTEPEPYVAIPAVQQLSYCYDSDELREMYANLLVSSMNIDTKYQVHPSFVDIIKQLTPDEAKLLKHISGKTGHTFKSLHYFPLIDLQIELGEDNGHVSLIRNYSNLGDDVCDAPENICAYIENLDRLKLICILEDIHLIHSEHYEPLETAPFLQIHKSMNFEGGKGFSTKKKAFYVTAYGEAFINTCIS